jgi:hypothetical protein
MRKGFVNIKAVAVALTEEGWVRGYIRKEKFHPQKKITSLEDVKTVLPDINNFVTLKRYLDIQGRQLERAPQILGNLGVDKLYVLPKSQEHTDKLASQEDKGEKPDVDSEKNDPVELAAAAMVDESLPVPAKDNKGNGECWDTQIANQAWGRGSSFPAKTVDDSWTTGQAATFSDAHRCNTCSNTCKADVEITKCSDFRAGVNG